MTQSLNIKIEPTDDGYRLTVNAWGLNVNFPTYDAAVTVANAIAGNATHKGVVTIDYHACLA